MMLVWLILVPLLGGVLAAVIGKRWPAGTRWVALLSTVTGLGIAGRLWMQFFAQIDLAQRGAWLIEFNVPWISRFGIHFHLAMDGLSLLLVLLTWFLGVLGVLCSWSEIQTRVGFYYFNLLWILSGVAGVFLAVDLFLFYCFWEVMLVPMYFLIGIWGHENRIYAALKFFIFTQASGLLMLLAILGLVYANYQETGFFTFSYARLIGVSMGPTTSMLLMLGFFLAFAVKLPMIPFHSWLPDAHSEAPTAGSLILAGLLLKTGAYGIMRFVLPLFPDASERFAHVAMVFGVIGILYGAVLAFAQTDLKRLVAYTSVSHLGFVLLGIYAFNDLAWQGVVMQMICHGLSTGALFILAGSLYERIHTRDLDRMGGFWTVAPRMGGVALFFAMASLGLPGLGNFVAEMLILFGAFQANVWITAVGTFGLVLATIYSLWIVQRSFHGTNLLEWKFADLGAREMVVFASLMAALVWLGVYPQAIFDTAGPALDTIRHYLLDPMIFTGGLP